MESVGRTAVAVRQKKPPPGNPGGGFWFGCEFDLGGNIEVEQPLNWIEEIFERVLENVSERVGDLTKGLHVCLRQLGAIRSGDGYALTGHRDGRKETAVHQDLERTAY